MKNIILSAKVIASVATATASAAALAAPWSFLLRVATAKRKQACQDSKR